MILSQAKVVRFLSNPKIVFYTLIWLMVILIIGTVAQKYIGLYRAQHIFFYSYIIWISIIPVPGGVLTLGFLTLSLVVKLFFASRWSLRNAGIIVTHIGVLLLLLGGLVTYLYAQEGNMVIYEGGSSNYVSDYHVREFVVEGKNSKEIIVSLRPSDLRKGQVLPIPNSPIKIEIIKSCKNCNILAREESDNNIDEFKGMARKMDIFPIALEKENEANRGAVQFRISGAGAEKDGIYFSADFIDASPWIEINGEIYNIVLRHKRTVLPFEIELIDFEKKVYPGTNKPKSYKSEVILRENGLEWRSIIQMNEPLRYRGYTFFQSSFFIVKGEEGDKEATVLAVVKNVGRLFPYISSTIMCIGLLMHVFIRLPKLIRRSVPIVVLGAAVLSPISVSANDVSYDYTRFAQIPILDQGRVKPLDTFARTQLEIIYGRDALPDMSAIEWLAEVIFDPDKAYKRNIFNIANPSVVDGLGLKRRQGHRYSYKEITLALYSDTKIWQSLLSKADSEMSLQQNQLLEIYAKTQVFGELSRSLSLIFPEFEMYNKELSDAIGVEEGVFVSFLKIRKNKVLIDKMAEDLKSKVDDKNVVDVDGDMRLLNMAYHMKALNEDRNSDVLKVIPPQWEAYSHDNEGMRLWFSPWGIGVKGQGSPDSALFLNKWEEIVKAFRAGDIKKWNELSAEIYKFSLKMEGSPSLVDVLALEVSFNNYKPFMISFMFYLSAFIVVMFGFVLFPEKLRKLAFALIVAGFAFHLVGIGVRMFIMGRPPVTNLYESVIFVSLIASLFGIFMEVRLKNALGVLIAASMGVILHFIGMRFDAEGDTMGMLVAVLDTNFWLATHVVTITIGYGACFVAGVLGHIYLIKRAIKPSGDKELSEIYRNMQGVVFIALLFVAIGTILGGIWADQSWGRFWGWDPKENGALLIVLWLIFVIHGRLGGVIGELGFAVYMVLTNIIVAMAWFGVNLLGVGLHSYGFTQNATVGFVLFCGFELLFAIGFYLVVKSRVGA